MFIGEIPLTDREPPELDKYHTVISENQAKVCTYIKDKSMRYIGETLASSNQVTITTTDNRKIKGVYVPHDNNTDEFRNPRTDGEVRLGDFNARHTDWYEEGGTNGKGKLFREWQNQYDIDH